MFWTDPRIPAIWDFLEDRDRADTLTIDAARAEVVVNAATRDALAGVITRATQPDSRWIPDGSRCAQLRSSPLS